VAAAKVKPATSVVFDEHIFLARPLRTAEKRRTEKMDFRTQFVRTIAAKDDASLQRLYEGVAAFRQSEPERYANLPAPLRDAAERRTSAASVHAQWDAHVKAATGSPGPALWPWWSREQPADAPSAEYAELAAKYRQCKRKVHRFEQWYAEFEVLNRTVTAQLNEAHQLLLRKSAAEPAMALDEVAGALLQAARNLASAGTSTAPEA